MQQETNVKGLLEGEACDGQVTRCFTGAQDLCCQLAEERRLAIVELCSIPFGSALQLRVEIVSIAKEDERVVGLAHDEAKQIACPFLSVGRPDCHSTMTICRSSDKWRPATAAWPS